MVASSLTTLKLVVRTADTGRRLKGFETLPFVKGPSSGGRLVGDPRRKGYVIDAMVGWIVENGPSTFEQIRDGLPKLAAKSIRRALVKHKRFEKVTNKRPTVYQYNPAIRFGRWASRPDP